jgi:FkbM family methyltransferase
MLDFVPYKLKWLLVKYGPRLEWSVSLPFGGRVRCNFLQQRIYPGRISKRSSRHEYIILRHYARSIKADTTFLDIGANIGLPPAAVGHQIRLNGGGHIYAFEPEPAVHGLLGKTITVNELNGLVTLVPYAVSDRSGISEFSRDLYSTATGCLTSIQSLSFGHSLVGAEPEIIQVNTISIDDWTAANNVVPTVVKIDVEGAEHLVLEGMSRTMHEHHPDIIVDGYTDKATTLLKSAGYRLYSLDTEDGTPVPLSEPTFTLLASCR